MLLDILPDHLRERSRIAINSTTQNVTLSGNSFVIYWMRSAVRADENPALDVAIHIALSQRIPLLVYHAISQNYQYASDRHHAFMIEGARDVQQQLARLGISYAFHLATNQDCRPHLVTLANRASLIVTEDMPVDPPRRYLKALQAQSACPIVCVDTACVAPMQLVGKAYTRAFKFRSATKRIYAERLTRSWPGVDGSPEFFDLSKLPFESLDLQVHDTAKLLEQCEIDHSVGPVVDTVGGSTAGYQRWEQFKQTGLVRYARQRNNALLNGVSRMSAYLHYGMVSPFRLARDCAELDHAGAEKYLDELLIWRELAYTFCFYREDHDSWAAIPEWAQRTLDSHERDVRQDIYSWEVLARGKTNDGLWNAAQLSLLRQGELHNNVRMTWGKAILNWKDSAKEALATIIDLNHRYALDGRDPASYGGILWCLGQFDRPFEPAQNVIGTVRPRPTKAHARRLDPEAYANKVMTPKFNPIPHVAIIGAGLSGLTAARALLDHGVHVTLFEKSRGVGGRMATRRADGGITFDHGAQYFTARDARFKRYVESWVEQGVVAEWPNGQVDLGQRIVVFKAGSLESESNSQQRFVGVPTMNAIGKHLAQEIEIQQQVRIDKVRPKEGRYELIDDQSVCAGTFDRVIVTAPAAQAAEILREFPELASEISSYEMAPCWATMASFDEIVADDWVGAFLHESFLTWVARNGTKPGRKQAGDQLVIHASPSWTQEHWEMDGAEVASRMLDELWRVIGREAIRPVHSQAHRWRYAIPIEPAESRCLTDESSNVIVCGDWLSGSRVEGAFLSGMAGAGQVLSRLSRNDAGG